jgi:5-formyltetrahydrofolate cyclo-ligase
MKKVSLSSMMNFYNKEAIRKELTSIRKRIPQTRRLEAQEALQTHLYPRLTPFHSILSFCSLPQEINLTAFNQRLASEGRLLLPKVEGDRLDVFHVADLSGQLARFSWKGLEPVPDKCSACSIDTVDCVLVPALGFDQALMRIGYGKGYYDKLIAHAKNLAVYPNNLGIKTHFIGIGFQEQLCTEPLPVELHDMRVDALLLF